MWLGGEQRELARLTSFIISLLARQRPRPPFTLYKYWSLGHQFNHGARWLFSYLVIHKVIYVICHVCTTVVVSSPDESKNVTRTEISRPITEAEKCSRGLTLTALLKHCHTIYYILRSIGLLCDPEFKLQALSSTRARWCMMFIFF